MKQDERGRPPPITRRRFRYDRSVKPSRHWLGGDPVETSFFNSLSVVFPRGEAFFIECVRPWQSRADSKLSAEIGEFIRQESSHGREHIAMNRGIVEGGYDTHVLEKVVHDVLDTVRQKDAIARLTYTMCFEHLTAILSSAILRDDALLARAEPEMRRLWAWHGVEEIEHKAVCFDTWMLATKDWSPARRWLTRSSALLIVTAGFMRNRVYAQLILLAQDGWSARRALPAIARSALRKGGLARRAAGDWTRFFKPGFHPWSIDDRHLIPAGESVFADAATPQPVVHEPVVTTPLRHARAA